MMIKKLFMKFKYENHFKVKNICILVLRWLSADSEGHLMCVTGLLQTVKVI